MPLCKCKYMRLNYAWGHYSKDIQQIELMNSNEMELRVAEGKASPQREIRTLRGRSLRNSLLESIGNMVSQVDEDGVVRMKILARKQDLGQILELVRGGKNNSSQPSLSVEQRLNLLRRKYLLRANAAKDSRRRSWTPALHSIPE